MSAFVALARRHVDDAGLAPLDTPAVERPVADPFGPEIDEGWSDPEPEQAAIVSEPVIIRTDEAGIAWLDSVSGFVAASVFEIATGRILASRSADRGLGGDVLASSMAWVMRAIDVAVGMMGGEGTFGARTGFELHARDGRIIVHYLGADVGLAIVVDQTDVAATNASLVLALRRALPGIDATFVTR